MTRLIATYRVRCPASEIASVAHALALEQSVEAPDEAVTDPWVRAHVLGQVSAIRRIDDDLHDVDLALSLATTGLDCAQTVNMLFGNSSLHAHVSLVDVAFPDALVRALRGPRFGIDGLRARLGVHGRALTCSALKPQGLPVAELARLCETMALGGVDVIKDDHGLADQAYAPFAERVAACQRAVERARRVTGRATVYVPSLVGAPKALMRQCAIVRDEGVGMVLLAPSLLGLPVFHELVHDALDVPVLAHPAFGGAARVAPPLLIGRLYRLLGADAVIYPNYGGRFSYTEQTCAAIAGAARDAWPGVRPAVPVPAGGMTVERVPELLRFYGPDVMLLIGGSLLLAGDRLRERTQAFADAAAAASAAGAAAASNAAATGEAASGVAATGVAAPNVAAPGPAGKDPT